MGPLQVDDGFESKFGAFASNALAQGYSLDEVKAFKEQARELHNRELLASRAASQPAQQPKKKGNFLTSLIPTGTSIAGAASGAAAGAGIGSVVPGVGTAIGGLAGALIGGFGGGFGGKVLQNKVEGEENLTKGALKEGAISGVLSAGPLRLGKLGIDTARGIRAGTSAGNAVRAAGEGAAKMSFKQAAGNRLKDVSDNLAIREFRLTPSQLANFKTKFGEDVSQVVKRYKLIGKNADDIKTRAIDPLQGEYDTIASQIPGISTAAIQNTFKTKYGKLISSAVEDNKAIGAQLKQQADAIVKKYGDIVPASEVNALRREFDSLVSYADKTANPARYGVNKRSADALRTVLQEAADGAGLKASNGQTFKEVGRELSKLRQLTENIGRQEQLGRGSLPFSLGNTPGAVVGAAGGVPGALAGYAGAAFVNSPTGRKALALGTEKAGQKLVEQAGKTNPFSVGQIAKRVAPTSIALDMFDQPFDPNNISQIPNTITTSTNIPSSSNMSSPYNSSVVNATTTDFSNPQSALPSVGQAAQFYEGGMRAMQAGDIKSAEVLMSFAEQAAKFEQMMAENAGGPAMSADQKKAIASASNAESVINQIEQSYYETGGAQGALKGSVRNLAGKARLDQSANYYNAQKEGYLSRIARAFGEVGTLNEGDIQRAVNLMPDLADTPENAQKKIQGLRILLSEVKQRAQSGVYGSYGEEPQGFPSDPSQVNFQAAY